MRQTGAFGESDDEDLDLLRAAFPRLKFIQVVRQNKIRQAISKARAEQTGLWKIQEGNVARGEAEFDPDLIASCLEDARREERIWAEFFERNGVDPLRVVYEELCEDYSGTIGRVLDYLEIKLPRSVRPKPETVRQTDSLSREWEERFLALA